MRRIGRHIGKSRWRAERTKSDNEHQKGPLMHSRLLTLGTAKIAGNLPRGEAVLVRLLGKAKSVSRETTLSFADSPYSFTA